MSLKLLVGLGNPGSRYDMTRHNVGFTMLDRLAIKCGANFSNSNKMQADLCKTVFEGTQIMLAKPVTYMNLSGEAVRAIANFYKIEKSDIMVAHDEVALPSGVIRLAKGGGAAGNHGIESIITCLGHKDFQRIRVGVGPDPGGALRAEYVLAKIQEKDLELFDKTIALSIDALSEMLRNGIQSAMNKFNGIDLREPPPPKKPREKQPDKSTEQCNEKLLS